MSAAVATDVAPRAARAKRAPKPTDVKHVSRAAQREAKKRSSWIQTYTGRKFRPYAPVINDIDIEDIAHALSMQCRWNGHIKQFYCVAQHAVLVSNYITNYIAAPWGLHHDDPEAYISDIPSPVKCFLPSMFHEAEEHLAVAVRERFRIPYSAAIADEVKTVDTWLMLQEGNNLLKHPELIGVWAAEPGRRLPDMTHLPSKIKIEPWPQEVAKARFLQRFHAVAHFCN